MIISSQNEADEAVSESGAAEDRAKKFMMDAARLAEELRAEQDNAVVIEKERREQEDVVDKLEEAERDELFDHMNKMERSRIINLADKHCGQMLDLIHR